MEVILKQDVAKLGKKGQVVKVSDGYARNFLFPKGLALIADESNMKDLSKKVEEHGKKEDRVYQQAVEDSKKLQEKILVIKSKSGGGEKLFGSITTQAIADELNKVFGISVDKKHINAKATIKTIGVHEVKVKFHPKVTANLKIEIQAL